MKKYWIFSFILCAIIISLFCGNPLPEEVAEEPGELTVDTLFATDSIGVLMGDSNYEFADISGLVPLEGGKFAVLDAMKCRVSIFSNTGNFLFFFGRQGEGPGEFLRPSSLTCLSDNTFLVYDIGRKQYSLFSQDGSYIDSWVTTYMHFIPLSIASGPDTNFLVYSFSMRRTVNGYNAGYDLEVFHTYDEDPVCTYFSHRGTVDGNYDGMPGYLSTAINPDGIVAVSFMTNENYEIEIYSPDGELREMFESAETEQVSLEDGIRGFWIPYMMLNYSEEGGTQETINTGMPEFKPQVGFMAFNSLGYLWARRGTEYNELFDVFSPEGNLIRKVIFTGFPEEETVWIVINRHGMAAYTPWPEDYPKVYLF